ncbi:sulfate/molybdate ABC transporter ATP-binding protein [Robiginitalea marina]|uniref:ATP-binding cassette domain-containing protein n=1 Tax=Robiginitalea marina TaxID=2954105 RepID=A0ABT1AWV8_9FLAO|nr:ATP-binding cassette domain-containing protein [Robiginitalea marina]MCO5724070.1 ATP-binding cassette domain-containing protein [Robiginitalea marina]
MISCQIDKRLRAAGGEMQFRMDLQVPRGQLLALYGASGAGKTSTLRMLAGLMAPDAGRIEVGGNVWFDSTSGINLRPQQRGLGFVFQDYALFPHLTVRQNLEFGAPKDQKAVVDELIDLVELGGLQHQRPGTLSGGQKQRVALARALVGRPSLLLLDEPLAALDLKIRLKLQDYLLRVHREYGLTTLLISHDLGEIHKLCDRVLVLEQGQVVREGTPSEVFQSDRISGKFKFTGEVLGIQPQEFLFLVTVQVQDQVVQVVALPSEVRALAVGDRVLVASKAFNPVLYKLD